MMARLWYSTGCQNIEFLGNKNDELWDCGERKSDDKRRGAHYLQNSAFPWTEMVPRPRVGFRQSTLTKCEGLQSPKPDIKSIQGIRTSREKNGSRSPALQIGLCTSPQLWPSFLSYDYPYKNSILPVYTSDTLFSVGVFPSKWLHPNGLDLCHSLHSSYVKFICFPYLDFTKCFLLNYPSCQFLPILAVLLLFPEMWHSSLNASSPLQLYLHKRFSGISVCEHVSYLVVLFWVEVLDC